MTTFTYKDVISVENQRTYPLNLNFKTSLKDKDLVNGPGVYLIALNDKPIYVGKHQPMEKSVFDRWLKSFQTLTFRGAKLGFNKRDKNSFFETLAANSSELVNSLKSMPKEELNSHFRDTGVNTSKNGANWVSRHWEKHFKNGNDLSVLDSLSFAYVKINGCKDQNEGNNVASDLETEMFNTYDFEINSNSSGREELKSLDNAISKALDIAHNKSLEAILAVKLVSSK